MADVALRKYERVWLIEGNIDYGLRYAERLAWSGDKSGCHEVLCDVLGRSYTTDAQLLQAEQLFTLHFGRMHVVPQNDRWRVTYFTSDNRFVDEDLDKNLLDNGTQYTQEQCVKGLKRKGRSLQGCPDVSDLIIACYQNKNHIDPEQRELINQISKGLEESVTDPHWLMTDSKARYCALPRETDLFIPHQSLSDGLEVRLAGDNYNVGSGNYLDITEAVTNVRDYQLVHDAFTDLGKRSPGVYRVSNKPQQGQNDDERVVVLGVDVNYLYILLIIDVSGCARGWSRRCARKVPLGNRVSGAPKSSFSRAQEMRVN